VLSMRIDSVVNPPWGAAGGLQGGTGRAVVNPGTPHEQALAPLSDGTVLRRGDILLLETGGGGGHGHPFDRPRELVLQDIRNGFVSREAALRDYGVAVSGDAVDEAATTELRHRRPAAKAFHRRGYVDVIG
jgi:N-methylhydantoinase B